MSQCVFQNCTGLKEVNILSGPVGERAFLGCQNLKTVTVWPINPPMGAPNMFEDTGEAKIKVQPRSVEAYKEAEFWKEYADRIEAMPDLRLK